MRIPTSTRWIPVILTALVVCGTAAVFYGGYEAGQGNPSIRTITAPSRPTISPGATLAQVRANFTGKPYVNGAIQELPGFTCNGWTNRTSGHRWIVLVCSQ